MKKILGVCGDSFMAAINDVGENSGYGLHFTEILGKKLDWDVVTFARGGCSNNAIRLQIDEIIKYNPSHVIIGLTSPDRMEIPIEDLKIEEFKNKNYYKKIQQINFIPSNGIFNIEYSSYPDQSSNHEGFKKTPPTLRSETLYNVFNYENSVLSKEQLKAVEYYYNYLYDFEWKRKLDAWVISDGLHKLKNNNIDFTVIISHFELDDFHFFKNDIANISSDLNPNKYYSTEPTTPYRFHLTEEDEIKLAEHWYKFLQNKSNRLI